MKKVLFILSTALSFSFAACSQKIDAAKVPAVVKDSFTKQFAGSSAKWEKEDGNYEAVFSYQGHEMSAVFGEKGNLLESETEIKVSELPPAAMAYIKINYKGFSIKEAAKITNSNGEVQYEAELKEKDLMFDVNGNFIKEVKK